MKPPHIIMKRSFKHFKQCEYWRDLIAVPWELVYLEDTLDHATESFNQLLIEVMDHHAPGEEKNY